MRKCMYCISISAVFHKKEKEKKAIQIASVNTNMIRTGNTDVELATLRELPRRGNFVHNSNELYTAADFIPTDREIALLPHIRRDQITLTKFLGSGAFGEVFEGKAKSLSNDETETRVAVKVSIILKFYEIIVNIFLHMQSIKIYETKYKYFKFFCTLILLK